MQGLFNPPRSVRVRDTSYIAHRAIVIRKNYNQGALNNYSEITSEKKEK